MVAFVGEKVVAVHFSIPKHMWAPALLCLGDVVQGILVADRQLSQHAAMLELEI